MRHIVIFAASGAQNLGDELIVLSQVSMLHAHFPQAQIYVASHHPQSHLLADMQEYCHTFYAFPYAIKHYPWKNIQIFFGQILHILKSDLIIIGGGGIFYDNEGGSLGALLMQWKIRIFFARLFQKKIFFWSVGLEIQESNMSRFLHLFRGSKTKITVRDEISLKLLKNHSISAHLLPDPVLLLPVLYGFKSVKQTQSVGICLRSGYLEDHQIDGIIQSIIDCGGKPVLLPFSFHQDNLQKNDFEYALPWAKKFSIPLASSMEETYEWAHQMDSIVAMRLHSMILGYTASIPIFLISYSKKTDEVARQLQIHSVLSVKNFKTEVFSQCFLGFWRTRQDFYLAKHMNPLIIAQNLHTLLTQYIYELEGNKKQSP